MRGSFQRYKSLFGPLALFAVLTVVALLLADGSAADCGPEAIVNRVTQATLTWGVVYLMIFVLGGRSQSGFGIHVHRGVDYFAVPRWVRVPMWYSVGILLATALTSALTAALSRAEWCLLVTISAAGALRFLVAREVSRRVFLRRAVGIRRHVIVFSLIFWIYLFAFAYGVVLLIWRIAGREALPADIFLSIVPAGCDVLGILSACTGPAMLNGHEETAIDDHQH